MSSRPLFSALRDFARTHLGCRQFCHTLGFAMREEEVKRCQIQAWYPKFKSVSIKTLIHELPESFVQYLLDDSGPFLLPQTLSGEDALPQRLKLSSLQQQAEDYHPWEEEQEHEEGEEENAPSASCFPDLEAKVKESIKILGGYVFPKLNWTAPKDAAWISTTGTLRCSSFSEIVLLLRSSDSLVHDLCHAFDSCEDKTTSRPLSFFLALRKWYPGLRPEMEFRCFVRGRFLVGISQREVTGFYPSLLERKSDIKSLIFEFFQEELCRKFESDDYSFDVYVTKNGRVKLIDFSPWGAFTLPLLFSWEELEENFRICLSSGPQMMDQGRDFRIEFRIVENKCAVRPGLKTAVPYDYIDTSPGSGWDQFMMRADEELQKQAKFPKARG